MARLTHPMITQLMGRPRYSARKPRRIAAGRPLYRSSANSTSVRMPARRHNRAKKKTVSMLPHAALHQIQLPAMPSRATRPATASGVSAANVVATIDVPASHHGRLRPVRKNSLMLLPPRRAYQTPMAADTTK